MKKFVLLALCVVLCFSSTCAEVIQIDTETATLEELKSARSIIDKRIQTVQFSNVPISDESLIISGSGTQILDGISIKSPISRFVSTSSNDMKLTYYTPQSSKSYSNGRSTAKVIGSPIELTCIMIETEGEWKIDFTPLTTMESPYTSGIGSYVTDIFEVEPPTIVNITLTSGYYGGYSSVILYKIDSEGNYTGENFIDREIVIDTESFDRIIKPEAGIVSYFWRIECPVDTVWSITEK